MTKRDLVVRIADELKINQNDVFQVVQRTLDYITAELAAGRNIELRNFGVFELRKRKGRVGRNPFQPKTDIPIPERVVVKFKAGKIMDAEVAKINPSDIGL